MSFKAIDMQFAVQKSTETGIKQNQLMQKSVLDQANLALNLEKGIEATRQRSSKVEETVNHIIRDDQQNGKNKLLKQTKKKQDNVIGKTEAAHTSVNSAHPYKGKHIDFSL
jgi:Ni,Fe-hydrogenase I large subunit